MFTFLVDKDDINFVVYCWNNIFLKFLVTIKSSYEIEPTESMERWKNFAHRFN